MRRTFRRVCAVAVSLVVGGALVPAVAADSLVLESAAAGTPHVRPGEVRAIAQVGNKIVLGGSFTEARNDGDDDYVTRQALLAFDQTTKQLEPLSLDIEADGEVNALYPAGGDRVFVGGDFDIQTPVGYLRSDLLLVDVGTGTVDWSFDPGFYPVPQNGQGAVKDVKLAGGRLWVGGTFTHVHGSPRSGLVALSPSTGTRDDFSKIAASGTFQGGTTGVKKIAITPDGGRLFAIGNFTAMGGQPRVQFAALDLNGTAATVADYRSRFYEGPCDWIGNSYPTDLDVSPDGSFVVVVTTGRHSGENSPCDSAARFETTTVGSDVRPSWIDHTGGDTLTAVEIAGGVVYLGGHFDFLNNPHSPDLNAAGPGAVARRSLAALDPENGLPLEWNPTRAPGVGVFDFLMTPVGLWVGSDTTRIGTPQTTHERIALLPAGGLPVIVQDAMTLPGSVYVTGAHTQITDPRALYRVDAAGRGAPSLRGIPWASDSKAAPSAHRRPGPRVKNRTAPARSAKTVPADTPAQIFTTSRLGTKKRPNQSWNFPVTQGQRVVVRLYFAKPCKCKGIGKWRQRVTIEKERKLKRLNITKAAGNKAGIMRTFGVTPTDRNLDIDFSALRGRTYIAAIEVLTPTLVWLPAPLHRRTASATPLFGALAPVPDAGPVWTNLRGAFMLGGLLYTAWADGSFTKQTFNGGALGPPSPVAGQDGLRSLDTWKDDIQSATSMFYDGGRIYFTRSGSSELYYRYFTPSTNVVGASRRVAAGDSGSLPFASFRGAFISGGQLYWASTDGALRSTTWKRSGPAGTPLASTTRAVSGTNVDANYWYGERLFLAP